MLGFTCICLRFFSFFFRYTKFMVVYVYICPTKTMILSCTSLYSFKLLNNYSLQNSRFFKKKKKLYEKKKYSY